MYINSELKFHVLHDTAVIDNANASPVGAFYRLYI